MRRNRLDLNTPAELAIRNAVNEVEKAGADVKLTLAVIKLEEARCLVADYVDSQESEDEALAKGHDIKCGKCEMLGDIAPCDECYYKARA